SPSRGHADALLRAGAGADRRRHEMDPQGRRAIRAQRSRILKARLFVVLVAAPAGAALAGPADYVFLPAVEYGERELDFKYGVATKKNEPSLQAASLGFGYGVKEWWFTEFYVKGEREGAQSHFDAIEFENKFQLTETGRYPIDIGFIAEFELPRNRSEGNEFRFGPLLQPEFQPVRTHNPGAVENNGTFFGYQWQVKYRWQPTFEFGAQGFGDMGRWNHFLPSSEQEQRLGPAIFGKYGLRGRAGNAW